MSYFEISILIVRILILHILHSEDREYRKFEFDCSINYRDTNFISSDIRSEGSIAIVKIFDFNFLMIFHSTSLPQSKNVFYKECMCVCVCVSVWPSPSVEPKPIDRSRSNSISEVPSQMKVHFLEFWEKWILTFKHLLHSSIYLFNGTIWHGKCKK